MWAWRRVAWRACIGGLVGLVAPAGAHHSPSIYDATSIVALQGQVSRIDWTNPHVYIFVRTGVTGAAGDTVVEWEIETDPVPILTRSGWTPDTLSPGERVSVRVNPEHDATRRSGRLVSISTEDGVVLTPRSSLDRQLEAPARAASAADIAGVWEVRYSDLGRLLQSLGSRALTERARSRRAEYQPRRDDPAAQCIRYPPPFVQVLPYLNEIEVADDTILIRTELFETERTIHMGGDTPGAPPTASNQGHSIGRWEDDVLVVETTGFEGHRSPFADGVPGSAARRLVERYRLSEDRARLMIDFVLEDPENLAEPFAGSFEWVYSPHLEPLAFPCDPEQARRYTLP